MRSTAGNRLPVTIIASLCITVHHHCIDHATTAGGTCVRALERACMRARMEGVGERRVCACKHSNAAHNTNYDIGGFRDA